MSALNRFHRRARSIASRALLVGLAALLAPVALPGAAQAAPATVVSLTFDDGGYDQYANARPLLDAHGMHGTFYINSGRVGAGGYMSQANLSALAAAGHEIGGHTVSHAALNTLSADDQRREICNDRVALLGMGFTVKHLAYPYGSADATTKQVAVECGYNSGRSVGGVVSPGSCGGCPYAESVPPADAYFTQTPDSVRTVTNLDQMKRYVSQAEEHGGGWVQLVMHHVCDGCGGDYEVSPTVLAAFLDWLAPRAASGTTVRTVDEVVGGPLQPGVPGPTLASPEPGELVQNASLESVGTNGLPSCFQYGGFGTNTYAWTRTTDAHTGSYAQQLAVSAWSSGDRKLVTRQDAGSCAPPAVAGHRYSAGVWYRGSWGSTARVQLVLYYRNSSGAWVYWATGPAVPASASWIRTPAYLSPPVPAGATGLSFGLALVGAGTLTTDDYTLVDSATG
ncbi:polysaccharide deacetylase family protein [Micromonospora purpureochromogenes]|uniref:Peptidoglycan/xylan/chitin deacetylase (PgdA/CDA1 family) n=1 Tax=Micromonospora purpureochromogenes TaxID=47872 RepID=A0ABX2RJ77_9ACTN|nr:polysaccharide deacetylase family protein [Micromonospora purpureochromogenes]NYF55364.1 peptidoglycan/xylan/chitin deacetylase (PgdA/CDA1 family) [Micromonospora purpureochromogenes]